MMAIEARERASNITNNNGLMFEGAMEAHYNSGFAARGSIAREGLSEQCHHLRLLKGVVCGRD